MPRKPSRREFLQETAAGAVVTSLSVSSLTNSVRAQDQKTSGAPAVNTSRSHVLGANDRVNFGYIGMGGRMQAHTEYLAKRQKEKADVQAVAICDIYEKHRKSGQTQTGVDDKSIHQDYRELCARRDVDAVV